MHILLTCGAGYIGSHVVLNLLDLGYKITVIDDLSTGHRKLIPKEVDLITTNINDVKTIDNLIKKKSFDALMHFAGFVKVNESVDFPEKYYVCKSYCRGSMGR